MERNYAQEIATKRAELDAVKAAMAAIAEEFMAATARFLAEWFPLQAKREVAHDADTTLRLQPADLSALKAEVTQLASGAMDVARQQLDKTSIWWHRNTEWTRGHSPSGEPYWAHGKRLPDILSDPVRYAMGSLARVLEARGYLKDGAGTIRVRWRNNSDRYARTDTPYYPSFHYEWPQAMRDVNARYVEQFKRALALSSEIDQLDRDSKRHEASGRWDSA
ncbi:MAG: hypothetical protein ACREPM_09025 [Gemmatimonadaceae bacterium]